MTIAGNNKQPSKFKCGYIGIIGRPNVGKSTLVNLFVNHKVSITTNRPQTTRHRILGIKTTDQCQLVFVDTPGVHLDRKLALNQIMNKTALAVITDVDVILLMLDRLEWGDIEQCILEELHKVSIPVVLVVNKTDHLKNKSRLLPYIQTLMEKYPFREIVPISAKTGESVDKLEKIIMDYIPESMPFFPEEQVTDKSERFVVAEIIREKLMRTLGQELPYSLTVEIESYKTKNEILHISAVIWVERKGQKIIVIGKRGEQLKSIGQLARVELEKYFDNKVFLQLWVKIKQGWTNNQRALRSLGYYDES